MKEYDYYLFDSDGTLQDTSELIYQCFLDSCKKFADIDIGRELVQSNIGLPLRKQMEIYIGPVSDEKYKEIVLSHMNYQFSIADRYLRLFPDVKEILEYLKKRNKKIAVVTSRFMNSLSKYLKATEIFDLFDAFITPEHTEKHKPDPEPVLKAVEILKAEKEKTCFIGDSEFDIECGNRAGVDTIFVSWSNNDLSSLIAEPSYVINSMKDLL